MKTRERVMAVVRWLLLLGVTSLAAYTVWTHWGPGGQAQPSSRPDRYYCSMHPQIRSPDPGQCPICHMDLELIPPDRMGRGPTRSADTDAGGRDHATAHDSGAPGSARPTLAATPRARSRSPAPTAPASAPNRESPHGVVPVMLSMERRQLIGIATSPVVRSTHTDQLRAPGTLEVPESGIARVHVRAEGFVERVAVRVTGATVRRGQPLAWIYSPEIHRAQEELLAALRGSALAQSRLRREGLAEAPGAPAVDLAGAARRALGLLGLAEADIVAITREGRARRAIAIRAPISGRVTRFAAFLGQMADPQIALYEISDVSRLWVIASVSERDLSGIARGVEGTVTIPGHTGQPLRARVELVELQVTEATRSARVRLSVPNPDGALLPGQRAEVAFELGLRTTLVVPRDAIVFAGAHEYVFVDTGEGVLEPRTVHTGATRDDAIEVLHGVSEGERVVSRGSFLLDSESRLRAALAQTPTGSPP